MRTEAIRYCIQARFGKEDYAEARLELTALETEINRLTTFNESMQTDARKNTETINKQAAEITAMKEQIQETLDLLRTGCAPDAFNMDANQWNTHKINRAASFLSAMLRGQK